ncbi:MAG TPA: PAC2 family protein [Acidimicrobiia bacterium]|nr:PAC2 family protein [Acidimicrobiia bacterium]
MTVRWNAQPSLQRPAMIAAFSGWNDAADAASDAVRWLSRASGARPFAALDIEEYLDFQAARPTVELVDGIVRTVSWPSLALSAGSLPAGGRDLVLLLGVEPNLRWRSFCDDVIGVARTTNCEIVVTLGALLGDTPHTRPIKCTGSATDEVLAARLGMQRSRYEGPTGIVGVLHDAVRRAGFASASIWAPVPHYVATPPNPKATRALLDHLGNLLDLGLDLTDLDIAASAWERSVSEVVGGDADVQSYVERLEVRYDTADDGPGWRESDDEIAVDDDDDDDDDDWFDEDELPSGESLAEDFERYLRDQPDE